MSKPVDDRAVLAGALGVWETVLGHIDAGVPIEGIRTIAEANARALKLGVDAACLDCWFNPGLCGTHDRATT